MRSWPSSDALSLLPPLKHKKEDTGSLLQVSQTSETRQLRHGSIGECWKRVAGPETARVAWVSRGERGIERVDASVGTLMQAERREGGRINRRG